MSTRHSFPVGKVKFSHEQQQSKEKQQTSEFMRVEYHNKPSPQLEEKEPEADPVLKKVLGLMKKKWKLKLPQLVISVTGGAKKLARRPRLDEIVKEGVVNAAVSTNAWIITGGTQTGVMELVGEAVGDYRRTLQNKLKQGGGHGHDREQGRDLVALGIASWRFVAQTQKLKDAEGKTEPAEYKVLPTSEKDENAPLDPNHTHFILVDDNIKKKGPGGEIYFRSRLEKFISSQPAEESNRDKSKGASNVLSVLIVVEGGVYTIQTVCESLKVGTPVIVIAGSGRAANFITEAYKTKYKLLNNKKLTEMAMKHLNLSENENGLQEQAVFHMKKCMQQDRKKLLTIFNPENQTTTLLEKEIKKTVLSVLMREGKDVLDLAIVWRCWDILEQQYIKPENRRLDKTEIEELIYHALLDDQPLVLESLLERKAHLGHFLDTEWLQRLYEHHEKEARNDQEMFELLEAVVSFKEKQKEESTLTVVGKILVRLLRDESFVGYPDKSSPKGKENPSRQFKHPERDLFLWAILFNRRQLAVLFWKRGQDHLGGALCASALLKKLARTADSKDMNELSEDLQKHSDEWQERSVAVLSQCNSMDRDQTHRLLVRTLPYWAPEDHGKAPTLFSIAEPHEMMEFVGHSACQTKLSIIWKGFISREMNWLQIFCGTFFPFCLPLIKMSEIYQEKIVNKNKRKPNQQEHPQNKEVKQAFNSVGPKAATSGDNEHTTPEKTNGYVDKSEQKNETSTAAQDACCFGKCGEYDLEKSSSNGSDTACRLVDCLWLIYYFYTAPVTKFFGNIASNLVHLGLLSYFVLVELSEGPPTTVEIVTWIWLFTSFVEELRQMTLSVREQQSIWQSIKNWLYRLWNRIDLAMYITYVISLILRFLIPAVNADFKWTRAFYSIVLVLSYLRCLQFFYAVKRIGPKVIMIQEMMIDMFLFFAVLLVFVLGFGVAYHANMFPNSPADWNIVVNVVYYTYFQIYGELFLEHMRGEDVNDCLRDEADWRLDPERRCPTDSRYILHLMLGIYLIMTNILLVNLLIAMFSYTFQRVQDNSHKVWRFYRLSLVHEYFDRPAWVPPFIIFNHIFRVFRHYLRVKNSAWSKTYCKKYKAFRRKYKDDTSLTAFERRATMKYLADLAEKERTGRRS